jgi:hypothetical protein
MNNENAVALQELDDAIAAAAAAPEAIVPSSSSNTKACWRLCSSPFLFVLSLPHSLPLFFSPFAISAAAESMINKRTFGSLSSHFLVFFLLVKAFSLFFPLFFFIFSFFPLCSFH